LTELAAAADNAAGPPSRPSSILRTISPTIPTSSPASVGWSTTRSISPRRISNPSSTVRANERAWKPQISSARGSSTAKV